MKPASSLSTIVLWTHEPFDNIRTVVESSINLYKAIISTSKVWWSCNSILATLEDNWSANHVQQWSKEFTDICKEIGLDFLFLSFHQDTLRSPQGFSLTASKHHLLASSLFYLKSETIIHDIPFNPSLTLKCFNVVNSTNWPTPYALMNYSTGLLNRKVRVVYIPSTDVYLQNLLGGSTNRYLGKTVQFGDQTLDDIVTGMAYIADKQGWSIKKF